MMQSYSGPVKAVILDWAGTTVDHGSLAPVRVLQEVFAARNVQENTTCIPHQESGSVINLKFESFAAAPPGAATSHP